MVYKTMLSNQKQEKEVPSFLLMNASVNKNDQKRLLLDLQLWSLWREVYGSKPFNYQTAVKLQIDLATQRAVHLRKENEKKLKIQETELKVVQSMRRKVAESVMRISSLGYDEEELSVSHGDIGFDTKIRDKLTGTNYGTIRSLLEELNHVTWEGCGNPFEDLEDFIENLKRYDDFTTFYIFDRRYDKNFKERFSPINILYEVVNFPKRPAETLKLTVKLKWQPFADSEILKKLKKQIQKTVTPHV